MKDGVMINAQAYHDTSLSNLLLTEKCSTGLSFLPFYGYPVDTPRRGKRKTHTYMKCDNKEFEVERQVSCFHVIQVKET